MAELLDGKKIHNVAFYLPQFHTIPENDRAYGKGFVEWVNTKKAKPLYEGHYEPRIPLGNNYYDLSDYKVMEKQSEYAQKNGVWGFCYYHYWFGNGKKLLEKPVENMLEHKSISIPFCLSWANENWSKKWDGGHNEVIMEQTYGGEEEWKKHFDYLLPFFKDERYITIDGKPLFLIYKPELIPSLDKMIVLFREMSIKSGLKGLIIATQFPDYYLNCGKRNLFDYFVEFEPSFSRKIEEQNNHSYFRKALKKTLYHLGVETVIDKYRKLTKNKNNTQKSLTIFEYDSAWDIILNKVKYDPRLIRGCFVDWDNTPRSKNGISYVGANPSKFGYYYEQLVTKTLSQNNLPLIFINAWNEWAEGAYLEPDEKYGFGYLNEIEQIVKKYSD